MLEEIWQTQIQDLQLQKARVLAKNGSSSKFVLRRDGMLLFRGRIYVPAIEPLRKKILQEARSSAYAMDPGSMKMY